MKKSICIVTGTRAEYGLLKPLIKRVYESEETELLLLVTGMHLSAEFGYTYKEIEDDGFPIWKKIDMLLGTDTPSGIVKSMGVEMMGLADCFKDKSIDMLVLLGDRYEAQVVAMAATIFQIPIAHIHGGERTEGIIDEAIRHSITKMSYLHFPTIKEYERRIIQLGENANRVYTVGSLGNESINALELLTKEELEKSISFMISGRTVLVTFHPVTLENMTAEEQFDNILEFLDNHKEIRVIFTKANSDTYGRVINQMIDRYVSENSERCVGFSSLGQLRYLSALKYVCMVIGNSSSGIIEVPSFGIPTINIGDRQKGRYMPTSVICCKEDLASIEAAYSKASSDEFKKMLQNFDNPYDSKDTSKRIFDAIMNCLSKGVDLKKQFCDIDY